MLVRRLWSLLRLPFAWKVQGESLDLVFDADCIIMLAFGQEMRRNPLRPGLDKVTIVPGPANEAIAKTLTTFLEEEFEERIPIIAQWEFTETKHGKDHNRNHPIVSVGSRDEYRNTYEVLQEAKRYMDGKGWTKAVIVAHPWHLRRCIWTAQRVGIKVVQDQILNKRLNNLANVWNDKVEVPEKQGQTTSLWRWILYELLYARPGSWLKGWI